MEKRGPASNAEGALTWLNSSESQNSFWCRHWKEDRFKNRTETLGEEGDLGARPSGLGFIGWEQASLASGQGLAQCWLVLGDGTLPANLTSFPV